MKLKKTVNVNESAMTQQLVRGMFSRGVTAVLGHRPGAAVWELVGRTLAQPHLVGKRS